MKETVIQFTSEVCVIFFIIFSGALCIERKEVYSTPSSQLQLNSSELEPSIYCVLYPRFTSRRGSNVHDIVNTTGEYDTNKYQIMSTVYTLNVRVPTVTGTYHLRVPFLEFEANRSLNFIDRKSNEEVLTFTYNNTQLNYIGRYVIFVEFYFHFHLKINAPKLSRWDLGRYECTLIPFIIQLVTAKILFLNQTDDNIIYVKEGMSTDIACTTVTGYNAGGLSLHQDNNTLVKSNNSIVTFTFTPSRHDTSDKYKCVANDLTSADIFVKLVVNYAPDVNVVIRVQSIDCLPKGFPAKYTFKKWEHQSSQGIHIRFIDGLQNGTLVLQTLSEQHKLNGRYVCTVSNGVPGINGSMFQKGFGSFSYSGAPIFVTENRKFLHGVPGEVLSMTFLLYSNPIIEKIWIGEVGTDLTKAYRMHVWITRSSLPYTTSLINVNISGYEILVESDVLRSSDFHEYKILAQNKFGVDTLKFQILQIESSKCNTNDKTQFIVNSSIATLVSIYIIVSHVYFYVRFRMRRNTQPYIREDRNNYTYDEIGSIAYQDAIVHLLPTINRELIQQIRRPTNSQTETATTNTNNQLLMNENTDLSSNISEQERTSNELLPVNLSDATLNTTSSVPVDENTHNENCSGDEAASLTDRDERDQDHNSQNSNRTSKSSSNSDESNGGTLAGVSRSDGYEHPYQSILPANQKLHHYGDLTNIPH